MAKKEKTEKIRTFWVLFVKESRSSISIRAVVSIDFRGSYKCPISFKIDQTTTHPTGPTRPLIVSL